MKTGRTKKDAILGRLALDRGLVTEEQLEECVREQQILPSDPNMTVGRRGQLRPLGSVMLEKGFVTERQLTDLMDEQTRLVRALEAYEKVQKLDYLFGQLLVKENKATQNQINKCLEIQESHAREGKPIPRLGELLVDHGFVDHDTIQDILKLQDKEILFCTNCGKQFNVVGVEKGKTYRCKNCGGIMVTRTMLDSLKVDETQFGVELRDNE